MIGTTIGSYRVMRELGTGGMGAVYLARHEVIGRLAAIKVLHAHLGQEEMVTRIFNEARLAALIGHPGLVDVHDFGRLPDGRPYMVMEYLQGETLAALLAQRGRLPLDLALAIARQVAAAIGAAHRKEIVHRDLKPDNVFIVPDEEAAGGVRVRILDFGIAKLAAGLFTDSGITRTGSLLGTPMYMSPEQCRASTAVDWRTDIYALGCILFEMLTGRRVFTAEGIGEVIAAHIYLQPTPPSALEPSLPPWIDAAVLRALAKRPEDRPQSMDQLVAELGVRPRGELASLGGGGRLLPPATTTSNSHGQLAAAPPSAGRRRLPWLLAAACLALAVGALLPRVPGSPAAPPPLPAAPPPPPAALAPPDAALAPPDAALAPPDAGPPPDAADVPVPEVVPAPAPAAAPARPRRAAKRRETVNPFEE